MTCSCCGALKKTKTGCSCSGGKSHTCLKTAKELLVKGTVLNIHKPLPPLPKRRVHCEDLPSNLQILAVNTDGTNRYVKINKCETLLEAMHKMTVKYSPNVMTVTEWGSMRNATKYSTTLKMEYDHLESSIGSSDNIQTLWRTDAWSKHSVDWQFSKLGRYLRVELTQKNASNLIIAHYSVHLPHIGVKNRQRAHQLLLNSLETENDNVDGIVISGDFNLPPQKLNLEFPQFTSLFTEGTHTTQNGTSKDNVLISDKLTCNAADSTVLTEISLFSHFPIKAGVCVPLN